MIEVKQFKQGADGRAVYRSIRILARRNRMGEVVPAPLRHGCHAPVPFNELENGHMI